MNPVILVGRRPDGGHRDRLWAWCRSRWETELGWPIVEGFHDANEGPFSFSAAINRAAASAHSRHPGWDVAVYIGADWLAGTSTQAAAAAQVSVHHDLLVFAHNRTLVLNQAATEAMLASPPNSRLPDPPPAGIPLPYESPSVGAWHRNTFSGVVAVSRPLWDRVGGFDERFIGWGFEDLAFWDACCAVGGGFERVHGTIAHLWHPQDRSQREDAPEHGRNQVLWERYREAKSDPAAMAALLAERT